MAKKKEETKAVEETKTAKAPRPPKVVPVTTADEGSTITPDVIVGEKYLFNDDFCGVVTGVDPVTVIQYLIDDNGRHYEREIEIAPYSAVPATVEQILEWQKDGKYHG